MSRFGEWLTQEIERRGWDNAELARRAHVSQMTVGRIRSGARQVGPDAALAIARALGESPEAVFRQAGFLPPLPPPVVEEGEVLAILREQSPATRRTLLSMLRGLAGRPALAQGRADYRTDPFVDELVGICQRLAPEWRPELLRAAQMLERNARGVQPRIIGQDEEERERERASSTSN